MGRTHKRGRVLDRLGHDGDFLRRRFRGWRVSRRPCREEGGVRHRGGRHLLHSRAGVAIRGRTRSWAAQDRAQHSRVDGPQNTPIVAAVGLAEFSRARAGLPVQALVKKRQEGQHLRAEHILLDRRPIRGGAGDSVKTSAPHFFPQRPLVQRVHGLSLRREKGGGIRADLQPGPGNLSRVLRPGGRSGVDQSPL